MDSGRRERRKGQDGQQHTKTTEILALPVWQIAGARDIGEAESGIFKIILRANIDDLCHELFLTFGFHVIGKRRSASSRLRLVSETQVWASTSARRLPGDVSLRSLLIRAVPPLGPRPEVISNYTLSHALSKILPVLQGMKEVETGVDAGPEYFVDQASRVFEYVLMQAIGKSLAVGRNVHLCGTEIVGQKGRDSAGQARVRSRIFGMRRGCSQSRPACVRREIGAAAAGRDGCGRSPEPEPVLGVEAANQIGRAHV